MQETPVAPQERISAVDLGVVVEQRPALVEDPDQLLGTADGEGGKRNKAAWDANPSACQVSPLAARTQ